MFAYSGALENAGYAESGVGGANYVIITQDGEDRVVTAERLQFGSCRFATEELEVTGVTGEAEILDRIRTVMEERGYNGTTALRVIFGFSVLYYLIPGYFLSLGLSFFVPKLYTAIAFDSGGVASGPLTSSFILPFIVGACAVLQGESGVLTDAFGLVAMVAMTPLITIQTLGFSAIARKHVRERIAMRRILNADDKQILKFL